MNPILQEEYLVETSKIVNGKIETRLVVSYDITHWLDSLHGGWRYLI